MSDESKLLAKLASPRASVRYEACEELRVSDSISPEAISALMGAMNDTDGDVADAAKRAYDIHTGPVPGTTTSSELARLFLHGGTTAAEVAAIDLASLTRSVAYRRQKKFPSGAVSPNMTDEQIARAVLEYAQSDPGDWPVAPRATTSKRACGPGLLGALGGGVGAIVFGIVGGIFLVDRNWVGDMYLYLALLAAPVPAVLGAILGALLAWVVARRMTGTGRLKHAILPLATSLAVGFIIAGGYWLGVLAFEGQLDRFISQFQFIPKSADTLLERYQAGERDFDYWNLRGANLRGADLRGADLESANLRGADLSAANLSDADLHGAKLRKANLSEADLSDAHMSRDLREANLRKTNLSGVRLNSADLRGADLSLADLSQADLSQADLSGADLSGADLSRASLQRADLSEADLSGVDLSGADLRWADLRGANLSDANLSGADLSSADLSRVNLSGFDLRGADLGSADLSGADLSGADLSNASLRKANLTGADLSGADLSSADLSGLDLSGVDLSGDDLSGFDLSGADLTRASLEAADLTGANLRNAIVTDEQLAATSSLKGATMPDGTVHE